MDEFMPEVDESNMQLLNRFGENADVSSMYSRSVTGSTPSPDDEIPAELLLVSPDGLPEIDDSDSQDSDSSSISGLLLKQSVQQHDKQVAIGDTIRFKSGHFNGDSSSSDDDSITRGLSFSGHSEVDNKHQQREQISSTLSLINPLATATTLQFLGNVLSQAAQMQTSSSPASLVVVQSNPPVMQQQKVQRHDSLSDDSEFEILNTEELDVDT
jgi:reticulophagy regulator